ncbi:MAG TPA: hypothetical protein VM144_12370 [Aestuariivirga sp.]|nr:hypothetical protein [Aestuariivirga sp.]
MKLVTPALMFLMAMTAIGSASTTKYSCKFAHGASEPLEINLAERVAYFGTWPATWSISGETSEFISMTLLHEVGGSLAVLNLTNGELLMASVALFCVGSVPDCTSGVLKSKLTSQELASSICTKQR